jgi:hypothetical protein
VFDPFIFSVLFKFHFSLNIYRSCGVRYFRRATIVCSRSIVPMRDEAHLPQSWEVATHHATGSRLTVSQPEPRIPALVSKLSGGKIEYRGIMLRRRCSPSCRIGLSPDRDSCRRYLHLSAQTNVSAVEFGSSRLFLRKSAWLMVKFFQLCFPRVKINHCPDRLNIA